MFQGWSRSFISISRIRTLQTMKFGNDSVVVPQLSYCKAALAEMKTTTNTDDGSLSAKSQVNLEKLFWSRPCSLALAQDSPMRIEEPHHEGIRHIILKLLLFYSKQSKFVRAANVLYKRIISQVDEPAIYNVFNLERTFKTTFSLLVLHTWLCLRRLKEEGKDGVEVGQYMYEIYNHDVEVRVSKAGVNLLLSRWMKDLEKIFYGNVVAYDAAMLPEASPDKLPGILWKNVFSDDGVSEPPDDAVRAVQAMSRYVRREWSCLSLTDKEAMLSGNFMFTSLEGVADSGRKGIVQRV